MFKEVVLSQRTDLDSINLVSELAEIRAQKARVYRTTVRSKFVGPQPETFLTTSKDVHLRLGQMSEQAQWTLACLIHESLNDDGSPMGILLFEDPEKNWALFATTMTDETNDLLIQIHLEPAR
ncbi:hypothetical protein H0W91_02585 [Patescibacteria group bacterium]|nr:hypothetical protein [Patescibacteria group bacterium]